VIGGLAGLVLGPLLWGRLALAVPIFILERRGPAASIARSWRLVRGAFWRTWGLRALVWLIVVVAGSILSAPLIAVLLPSALKGHAPSTAVLVLLVIFSAIAWAVTQPLIAASLTLIYVDRRMRAEGLDLQLTQAARAAAAATATPASSTPGGYPGAAPAGFPA
jgi:membrane-anchored glycerophosphoryl diester phosphodiesterase (GDPDase)